MTALLILAAALTPSTAYTARIDQLHLKGEL